MDDLVAQALLFLFAAFSLVTMAPLVLATLWAQLCALAAVAWAWLAGVCMLALPVACVLDGRRSVPVDAVPTLVAGRDSSAV